MVRRRVALYGGAFDPPHRAHVAVARAAVQQLGLDELRVVPTGRPAHRDASTTAGIHRVAMAKLAFASLPQVVVDSLEVDRPETSFTVGTLQTLCAQWRDAEVFLIIGQDQWKVFDTWSRWQNIAEWAQVVVVGRPDAATEVPEVQSKAPAEGNASSEVIQTTAKRLGLSVLTLAMPPDDTSATQLRHQLQTRASHQSARFLSQQDLLDVAVAKYIDNLQLYR